MRIYSVEQIRSLEKIIAEELVISNYEAIELAAEAVASYIQDHFDYEEYPQVHVFCGPGNNGCDGLLVGELLATRFYDVVIFDCSNRAKVSKDWQKCKKKAAKRRGLEIVKLMDVRNVDKYSFGDITIDALFGFGLDRPMTGFYADLVTELNTHLTEMLSIDLPSGMAADTFIDGPTIKSDWLCAMQFPKLAYYLPDYADYIRRIDLLNLYLGEDLPSLPVLRSNDGYNELILPFAVSFALKGRRANSHKGTYGHGLLVAGAHGKIGSSLLAGKALLRSGAGLLTIHSPKCGYQILQIGFPEAMVEVDQHEYIITNVAEIETYQAIGIGPGIGKDPKTREGIEDLLKRATKPVVLDADALNLLSDNPHWWELIPENSILTPHPGEAKRLFGSFDNGFEELNALRTISRKREIVIILKRSKTIIFLPDGSVKINTTGNPGMATAGSGDVLTGVLTGLLAQGYAPNDAAMVGVCLHSMAGDRASKNFTQQESILASDIIDNLGNAYAELHQLHEDLFSIGFEEEDDDDDNDASLDLLFGNSMSPN